MSDPTNSTKQKAITLANKIQDMKNHFRGFSGAMRSLYVDANPGGDSVAIQNFQQLRDATRNDAEVYLKCILPLSKQFVKNVDSYFETFGMLTYDQWKQSLSDLVKEAQEYKEEAECVIQIHKQLITVVKQREDRAEIVVKQLGVLKEKFEEKAKEEEHKGHAKHIWAICLAFLPGIDLIAGPILWATGDNNLIDARADFAEAKMTVSASLLISKTLLPALEDFIAGLVEAAGFFEVLISDLENFIAKGDVADKTRKFYFFMMQGQAKNMKSHCDLFYMVIPDVETDFSAIKEDSDQNYVEQWRTNEKKFIMSQLRKDLADKLISLIEN